MNFKQAFFALLTFFVYNRVNIFWDTLSMNVRNNAEALEAANTSKKKWEMSIDTFLTNFSRKYIETLPTGEKNALLEKIMNEGAIADGGDIDIALKKFRADQPSGAEIDLSKVDIYSLRKKVAKGYLKLQNLRDLFYSEVMREYGIETKTFENKVEKNLAKLSQSEIEALLGSEKAKEGFLKKSLGVSMLSKKIPYDIFAGVDPKLIESKIKLFPKAKQNEVTRSLSKIENSLSPSDDDIRVIISSGIIPESKQLEFVHTFIPLVNLEQAIHLWIIWESQAKKLKDVAIKTALKGTDVSNENKQELEKLLDFSDIEVATRDIAKTSADAEILAQEVGFQGFINDLETEKSEQIEKLKQQGPATFELMKAQLSQMNVSGKYWNLAAFSPGNIIRFVKKQKDGENAYDYVRIVDFDNTLQEFRYQNVGNETINLDSPAETLSVSYLMFVENLKSDPATSFQALSKEQVSQMLKNGEIKSNDLQTLTPEYFDLEENAQKKIQLHQKRVEEIETEILALEGQLANADDDRKWELSKEIESLKRKLSTIRTTQYTSEMAAEDHNRYEFLAKLDDVDPEGAKLGFKKGVTFYTGEKMWQWDFWTYTISNIDYENWKVFFTSEAGKQEMNLDSFYEGFKKVQAKRIKSVQSVDELFHLYEGFTGYEFSNGKIIAKNVNNWSEKSSDEQAEYLSQKGGKQIVKIVSLSNSWAQVQVGEIENVEKKDLKKNEKSRTNIKIKWAPTQSWSLDELSRFIRENKLTPDWKLGKTIQESSKDLQNDFKDSMSSRFMQGISFYEVIAGWKMLIEWVKESFKHGSDVKAAKAALAMGRFLPEDLREDIQSKVEAAESEEMDKALKKLGAVDSWIAIQRIENWLLNRDTPEHMKEAGMLFMLEKYGHLTAKKALAKYRWKFLWYEAFGGRIGDELYNEEKEAAEKAGQTFSEEYLMLKLLKKQCWEWWYKWIHRRSRLHKEFDNKWKNGIKAELEKGYSDASNYRDVETIISEAEGEAKGGTTSNAFGWMKRVSELWASLERVHHLPFVFLASGACYNVDQASYLHVKKLWDAEGQSVILYRMFANKWTMDLFQETFLELAKEIQNAYSDQYPNILKDAQEIYNNRAKWIWSEAERIAAASSFWKKYQTPLSRAFNNSLESDGSTSKTDTIVKRKSDENAVLGKYNNLIRGAVGEGNTFNKDIVDDWAGETGIFGLNIHDIILKFLTFDQGWGFREKSIGPKIWNRMVADIDATPNKVLLAGKTLEDPLNKIAQRDYIAAQLEEIVGAFYEMSGQVESYIYSLNKPTSLIGRAFNKWGMNLQSDLWAVAAPDIQNGSYRRVFEKVAEKIIHGGAAEWGDLRSPSVLMNDVKNSVNKAANSGDNPYDPWSQAA